MAIGLIGSEEEMSQTSPDALNSVYAEISATELEAKQNFLRSKKGETYKVFDRNYKPADQPFQGEVRRYIYSLLDFYLVAGVDFPSTEDLLGLARDLGSIMTQLESLSPMVRSQDRAVRIMVPNPFAAKLLLSQALVRMKNQEEALAKDGVFVLKQILKGSDMLTVEGIDKTAIEKALDPNADYGNYFHQAQQDGVQKPLNPVDFRLARVIVAQAANHHINILPKDQVVAEISENPHFFDKLSAEGNLAGHRVLTMIGAPDYFRGDSSGQGGLDKVLTSNLNTSVINSPLINNIALR